MNKDIEKVKLTQSFEGNTDELAKIILLYIRDEIMGEQFSHVEFRIHDGKLISFVASQTREYY
jgi:hypothetical protein